MTRDQALVVIARCVERDRTCGCHPHRLDARSQISGWRIHALATGDQVVADALALLGLDDATTAYADVAQKGLDDHQ